MSQQNRILASLPLGSQEALKPHLKTVELKHGTVLFEPGATVDHVYFPRSGVISLVVELEEGDMLETAMVGRDGVLGVTIGARREDLLEQGDCPSGWWSIHCQCGQSGRACLEGSRIPVATDPA